MRRWGEGRPGRCSRKPPHPGGKGLGIVAKVLVRAWKGTGQSVLGCGRRRTSHAPASLPGIGIGRPPSSAQVADYVLERFRETEVATLAPVLDRICGYIGILICPDGTITQQAVGPGIPRGVSAFLNCMGSANKPPRAAPAPPSEPQPEPEPEPVPVSRTGLSDGVTALGCADDGAPAPKRSKSVPASK